MHGVRYWLPRCGLRERKEGMYFLPNPVARSHPRYLISNELSRALFADSGAKGEHERIETSAAGPSKSVSFVWELSRGDCCSRIETPEGRVRGTKEETIVIRTQDVRALFSELHRDSMRNTRRILPSVCNTVLKRKKGLLYIIHRVPLVPYRRFVSRRLASYEI